MAVKKCRERCWKKGWVLDLDVQKFFDSVDHELMIKAVEANTDQKWVVLYVKRWLTAPMQMPDGTVAERDRGTPQGQRYRQSWPIPSCIRHSIRGWNVSSRPWSSSVLPMTRWCTV